MSDSPCPGEPVPSLPSRRKRLLDSRPSYGVPNMKSLLVSGAVFTAALALAADIPPFSSALQSILANTDKSNLYHYPTDLTQGIIPVRPSTSLPSSSPPPYEPPLTPPPSPQKPIHSHNDYWRTIPFYTALSYGCVSTEADVWLYNQTLYIGHEQSALTTPRTFTSLYINPILDTLRRQNPTSAFVAAPTRNGVFDTNAAQTLYLFIDVKTEGNSTWPSVLSALDPLRQAGFLTRYNASAASPLTLGPITVMGTGNSPLPFIASQPTRDYFYDAHLDTLLTSPINITSALSPIASASFLEQFGVVRNISQPFNSTQMALLRQQIGAAHARGIKVRYYELPSWPITLRDEVWRILWDEGVDLINADDLAAAAETF